MASSCNLKKALFYPSNHLISFFSTGKHASGLFFHRRRYQSSIFGGILTLLCSVVIVVYSAITLYSIFAKESFIVEDSVSLLNSPKYLDLSLEDLETLIFKKTLTIYLEPTDPTIKPKCEEVTMKVSVDLKD
jgi:hypothetical protein